VELVAHQVIFARTFQDFDGAVLGPGRYLKAFTYGLDGLVVVAVGNQADRADNFGKTESLSISTVWVAVAGS
jgi:hypothetical protein